MSDSTGKLVEVRLRMPWKIWEALQAIAQYHECNTHEAIRRCISVEKHRIEAEQRGARVVEELANGERYELTWYG